MADTIRLDFTNELKSLGAKTIQDYNCQGRADIIGVVVDTRPPQPARNHCDASVLMRVADPSTGTLGGLKIQSFHKLLEGLPQVKVGDILVTRNLSLSLYMKEIRGVLTRNYGYASWTGLDGHTLEPKPSTEVDFKLSESDLTLVCILQRWYKECCGGQANGVSASVPVSVPVSAPLTNLRPTLKTRELGDPMIRCFDYIGHVISKYNDRETTTFWLTDYTINPKPKTTSKAKQFENVAFRVPDKMLLGCTLWDENIKDALDITTGDFVWIRKAKWKMNKQGVLEIIVHGEPNSKQRNRKVIKLDKQNARVKYILEYMKNINEGKSAENEKNQPKATTSASTLDSHSQISSVRSVITSRKILPFTSLEQLRSEVNIKKEYITRGYITAFRSMDPMDWFLRWCSRCQQYFDKSIKECQQCNENMGGLKYRFCIVIRDARETELLIYCIGSNIYKLFPDLPRTVELESKEIGDILQTKIDRMCHKNRDSKVYLDLFLQCVHKEPKGIGKYVLRDTNFLFE